MAQSKRQRSGYLRLKGRFLVICFKEFSALSPVELELVFAWRNDGRIRKHFINEAVGYDEHFAFAKSLKDDESKRYFLILTMKSLSA